MKNIKNRFLVTTLSIGCIIMLLACNNKQHNYSQDQVFKYNEQYNIATLDPAFARNPPIIWPVKQLFNGLVKQDDSLNIVPDIAKRWEISDDATTYTFTLKEHIYFHPHEQFGKDSTRAVVAQDFVYSFNRLTDPQVASPGGWVLNNVEHYQAVNDSTLVIELKKPFPAFLGLLSMGYCAVVPQEIVSLYGNDFRSQPIGTGPFKFKRWKEGVKLVLRRNKNYFEKDNKGNPLPYLEAIAITFLPDKQSEFLQFAQGNLDLLNSLDPSYKDELLTQKGKLQEKYKNEIEIVTGPFLNTEYIGFYLDSPEKEIQSKLLRKAVNYGFDRKKMITYLRNGIGIPANAGFIPLGLPGHGTNNGYTYNPSKSLQLIEQYKKETGSNNPSISIATNSQYLDICEYIQRELGKLGLSIEIDVMPPSTLRQMKSSGQLGAFRASWIADYPDAENYLSLYYSKNFTPGGPNYTHFYNTGFDSLYQQSFRESEIKSRSNLYQQMDSIIMDNAPIVPLYYDQVIQFVHKNVKGYKPNPQNFLDLTRVKKIKNKE